MCKNINSKTYNWFSFEHINPILINGIFIFDFFQEQWFTTRVFDFYFILSACNTWNRIFM
jgi:hypothetical protein